MSSIAGHCLEALNSLTPSQITFIQSLPKAELHAHLNGSIPINVLQSLAREYIATSTSASDSEVVQNGIEALLNGVQLREIHDFFGLFPAIYALTSTPAALARATSSVLEFFLGGPNPECTYLEVRTTPRATEHMTRRAYVEIVLAEVDRFNDAGNSVEGQARVGLIVSLDRRMGADVARECLDIAISLKEEGRRVVGVDLCGDPIVRSDLVRPYLSINDQNNCVAGQAGDMQQFTEYFREAKDAGLGVTLHIAETRSNSATETLHLLSFAPDRLGHATFLNDAAKDIVLKEKICIEICLSSNLLCNTVNTLDDHHMQYYLKNDHPIAICTDDPLPFRNSLLGEYALLLAERPFGLGLSQEEVRKIAQGSLAARFI